MTNDQWMGILLFFLAAHIMSMPWMEKGFREVYLTVLGFIAMGTLFVFGIGLVSGSVHT